MSMPPKTNEFLNQAPSAGAPVSQKAPVYPSATHVQRPSEMQSMPVRTPEHSAMEGMPRRAPSQAGMNGMPRRAARPENGAAPQRRMSPPGYREAGAAPQQNVPVQPARPAPRPEVQPAKPSVSQKPAKADKAEQKRKKKNGTAETKEMFGSEISFAAKEAYKLLRTNLMFALSGASEDRGRIVGVTSSLRGEGKSTTTLNLATVLAEQGKKVVVVEGDLRLPSLKNKLDVQTQAGLSHVLITKEQPDAYLRKYQVGTVDDKPIFFDMLLAGEIPPNPSELLGSKRMEDVLDMLASKFDFVILDLPPVTAVSDALVATKLVDGVVLVVRNEHADTGSLNEAIRQIHLVDGKILGFVFTCANAGSGGYRKKYKYHHYYNYTDYR